MALSKGEKEGREKFTKLVNQLGLKGDVEFFNGEYDRADAVYNHRELVEIKNRDYPSTAKFFWNEGILIEKDKYDYLKNEVANGNYINATYIFFFSDGACYAFNTKNEVETWKLEKVHKSKYYQKGYTEKYVAYIPLSRCKKLDEVVN